MWWLTSITLALLILQGCERNGIEKDIDFTSDTGYEGFQSDVELFYEFAYLKEAMILEFLNYTSDGFTKGPLEGTLSMEECRRLVGYVANISEKKEQYEAAAQRLEQSGVLLSPTRTRGLFGSVTKFFRKVSGIDKRNRQRFMVVFTNVERKDARTDLYKSALWCWDNQGWPAKPSSEQEFYHKMNDGSYDEHGTTLMGVLLASDNADVITTLQEKGLTLQDLTKDYGEIVVGGAEIALDGFATVVPGAGIGMEAVKVTDNMDRLANAKDFNEKAKAKEDMKKYIREKIFGEDVTEVTDFVCEELAEHIERVSQEATREIDKKTQGQIVVKDKNEEQPAKIVISQKKESTPSDDGPSIFVTGRKWVKEGIDQVLAVGKWLVTAINEQGRRETVEINVEPGKITVTEVNTAEPEEEEEEEEEDDQPGGKTYYLLGDIHFFTVPDAATAREVDLTVYHDSWHINFRGSRGLWLNEFSYCTEPTDFFALKQNRSDKKQFSGKNNVSFDKTISALGRNHITSVNDIIEMELTLDKAEKPTKITKLTLNYSFYQEGRYADETDIYVFDEKSSVSFKDIPISLLTKYTKKVEVPAKWMKSATYVYNTTGGIGYVKGSDLSPYLVSATGTKKDEPSKKLFAKNTIITFYYVEKK